MATCMILMFGRLGAVAGSNFVGILLDGHCELIFYLYGILILSKFIIRIENKLVPQIILSTFYVSGCSFVCVFLNTNPVEPSAFTKGKSIEIKCET